MLLLLIIRLALHTDHIYMCGILFMCYELMSLETKCNCVSKSIWNYAHCIQ